MTSANRNFGELGRNGRVALQTLEITEGLVKQAGQPGFSEDAWDELAALYAVDEFQRVAANRESRDWAEDIRLKHQFALIADFSHEIRRIAEVGDTVFVDTIETVGIDGESFSVNTLGVLEFNSEGLIRKATTYQQWDPERVPGHVARPDERQGLAANDEAAR